MIYKFEVCFSFYKNGLYSYTANNVSQRKEDFLNQTAQIRTNVKNKRYFALLLFLISFFTCFSMEKSVKRKTSIDKYACQFIEEIRENLAHKIYMPFTPSSSFEFIQLQAYDPHTPLIASTLVVTDFGTEVQKISYYMLSAQSFLSKKLSTSHWLLQNLADEKKGPNRYPMPFRHSYSHH